MPCRQVLCTYPRPNCSRQALGLILLPPRRLAVRVNGEMVPGNPASRTMVIENLVLWADSVGSSLQPLLPHLRGRRLSTRLLRHCGKPVPREKGHLLLGADFVVGIYHPCVLVLVLLALLLPTCIVGWLACWLDAGLGHAYHLVNVVAVPCSARDQLVHC